MRHLLSINDLHREEVEEIIQRANRYLEGPLPHRPLFSFILATFFFEASTRTRLGFEAATYRLGGQTVGLSETKSKDNMSASESLEDTVRIVQDYSDIICLRHPDEHVFSRLKDSCSVPLINAGNGADEHPTQALTDLFTIRQKLGRLDDLDIAIVGDLRHMRTAHSLVLALSKYQNIRLRLISPESLKIPERYRTGLVASGSQIRETEEMDLSGADVVYMTGFAPKTPVRFFDNATRSAYQLRADVACNLDPASIILCPMPRVDEITPDVDTLDQAKYFQQSKNGLYVRMAVLDSLLYNRNHVAS